MSKDLVKAIQVLEEEKGISRAVIKDALETALELAYKKNYDQAQNVEVDFNEEKGSIKVFAVKEVVEVNYDSTLEISLEEAQKINPVYEIGDKIRFEVTPKDFGRIATQTAKHVIMQRIREAEREIIFNEYSQYLDEVLTGTVERQDYRYVYVNLGRAEAVMPINEQIPGEQFTMDERIMVYVAKVDKTTKGPQVVVSRAHEGFLKRLFEKEVPEIYSGIVEIMSIAREAGDRSKVAVRSRDTNVDPVGTCVGQKGQRVQTIVNELNGENMDIVQWDEDPAVFIKNAMNPATVEEVIFDGDNPSCIVVVPDHQLSLAIGKKGQNARLAARLTKHKIDIKSVTAYQEYLAEQEELKSELAEDDEATVEAVDSVTTDETNELDMTVDETIGEVEMAIETASADADAEDLIIETTTGDVETVEELVEELEAEEDMEG